MKAIKLKYRSKLFLYFFLVFFIFSSVILFFLYQREKSFKIEKLDSTLNLFAEQVDNFIVNESIFYSNLYSEIIPFLNIISKDDLRVSIIDISGNVLFDSSVENNETMDNHLSRIEIKNSLVRDYGSNIRKSSTTGTYYYYFAKKYDNYFIRTALPYTADIKNFLKADIYSLFVILFLFFIISFLLIYVSDMFGKTISKLKEFVLKVNNNEKLSNVDFGKNELGEIGNLIRDVYYKMKNNSEELSLERNRLINFLNVTKEGIAIFSSENKLLLSNSHFISYVNTVSKHTVKSPEKFFDDKAFVDIKKFISDAVSNKEKDKSADNLELSKKIKIFSADRKFKFQVFILNDFSYQISINDITEIENEKKIKENLTANIAHELKTPVAAISGYMETILENPSISEEKIYSFVGKSYNQALRLSSLINDISILNKIDDAKDMFEITNINVSSIIKGIFLDFDYKLKENNIKFDWKVSENIIIEGNIFLIDTIFRNLIDNSINYAGKFCEIIIKVYSEDNDYIYFSYKDTGEGIPEQDLSKIFERFYRVDSGRSRKLGGTGLGLSIVKHAVDFHKGEIYAKQTNENGVNFNFSLKKKV